LSRALNYTSDARRDLEAIAEYIVANAQDSTAPDQLLQRLKSKCEQLADLPGLLGTSRHELADDLRSTPCGPFIIFFRYRGDVIEIVNVLRASQNLVAYFGDGS
jgi:toxin ParE1/3/4